jgi:hypothetical protein
VRAERDVTCTGPYRGNRIGGCDFLVFLDVEPKIVARACRLYWPCVVRARAIPLGPRAFFGNPIEAYDYDNPDQSYAVKKIYSARPGTR